MILDVPYYSQRTDVHDTQWKGRACGITCLKMTLDFLGAQTPSLDELIQQGLALGGYGDSGWIHKPLAELGKTFGISMHPTEFRLPAQEGESDVDILLNKGISELVRSLANGNPVLISSIKEFTYKDKYHMMLLVGYKVEKGILEGFYYHDPDADSADIGKNKFVPLNTFKECWRRMAMIIGV